MVKVYLDNNVFVDVEAGRYNSEDFLARPDTYYYYSSAHLDELLEARGNPKVSQEGRLRLFYKICGQHYILTGGNKAPEFIEKEPNEMYILCDSPLHDIIAQIANASDKLSKELRDRLGFDSRTFNNVSPELVLEMIDEKVEEILKMDLLTENPRIRGTGTFIQAPKVPIYNIFH